MTPDFLTPGARRPRRWPLWLGGLLLAACAVALVVSVLSGGDPKPRPVARPVAPKPKPKPKPEPKPVEIPDKPGTGRDWPLYGNGPGRTRHMRDVNIKPPFRRVWALNGGKLIEFQPVLAGGRLFVLKNDGRALALAADTGKIRWRRRIGGLAASAPAAAGASVYFNVNHGGYGGIAGAGPAKVVAMNRRTGRIRWAKRLSSASESSPLVIKERVFVGSQNGTVYALSAKSGRLLWRHYAGGPVKGALAYSRGKLYFGDYGGSVTALRWRSGHVAWRSSGYGQIYATPAVAFGRVYIGSKSGAVYALSASSGRRLWSRPMGGYVYAAPAVGAVKGQRPAVFIGSYGGRFAKLDARSGGVIWSRSGYGKISGAASIIGRIVYFSSLSARRTWALSTKTGRVLWSIGKGAFNPAISDGKRVYITGYGSQYAFMTPRALRHERIALAKRRKALERRRQQAAAAQQPQS
jgi:outer membrane protein assembly factor BamB